MSKKGKTQGRKERLKKLILGKVENMFGKKLRGENLKFARVEADKIVQHGGGEKDIKLLVKTLKKRANALRKKKSSKTNLKDSKAKGPAPVKEKKVVKKKSSKPEADDLWSAIVEMDIKGYNNDVKKLVEDKKQNKISQKDILDAQIKAKREQEKKQKEESLKWNRIVKEKHEIYLSEEAEKQKEKQRHMLEEKLFREKQLVERELRLKKIEDKRKKEDQELLEQIRLENEREKLREIQKRKDDRDRIEKHKLFNEQERLRREETKRKIHEEDLKLQKAYIKRLEKEEMDRKMAFQRIYNRQKIIHENIGLKVFKSLEEKEKDDERRAMREQAEMDAKKEREHQLKVEKHRKDTEEMKKLLMKQIALKKRKLELDLEERIKEKEYIRQMYVEEKESKKKKLLNRKRKNEEYARSLQGQIVSGRKRNKEIQSMSDHERKLNKKLLLKLANDL